MSNKVKKISAFQTNDGKVFQDGMEAHDHQSEINIKKFLEDMVNDFHTYNMTVDDLVNDLYDRHVDMFREFKKYYE